MKKISIILLTINIIMISICIKYIITYNQQKSNNNVLSSKQTEYNKLINDIETYTNIKEKYNQITNNNTTLEEQKNNLSNTISEKNKEIENYNNKIKDLNTKIDKLT